MGALPKENGFFTYADYKAWELSEGERYEIIYGEAYAMSAPGNLHQLVLGGVFYQFYGYLRGKPCKVYPAPYDVRLFYAEDESDDTVVQPDISIVCDEKKRGSEGCRGAPDLVIEILSPSNSAIEMDRKLKLYKKAGVREYWVIDPEGKRLTVYNFIEANTQQMSNQIIAHIYGSTDIVPVLIFPDLKINLEQVFAE